MIRYEITGFVAGDTAGNVKLHADPDDRPEIATACRIRGALGALWRQAEVGTADGSGIILVGGDRLELPTSTV